MIDVADMELLKLAEASTKVIGQADVWHMADFKLVYLKTEFLSLGSAYTAFIGDIGWAKFQKKVVLTEGLSKLSEAEHKALGVVLFAEWVGGGSFYRIFSDPSSPGLISQVQITESLEDSDSAYLRQIVKVASDGAAKGKTLIYHVYWTVNSEGEIRRAFDAFAGFENDGHSGADAGCQ
jgi:hypothetical protein